MMLPILISVSLAPGSYFFWAWAAVTVNAAIAASKTRLLRAVIVLSPLCFDGVSQAATGLASIGLFRGVKRYCCAPPIMIDAWQCPSRPRSSEFELRETN